ncbi:MAG: hypothetical protein LBP20_01760 [Treponema sp.]|jgi:hypothetical protein|nr:hypothetical protein [Treponema sp.]
MIIKDLSDAGIDAAGCADVKDTLKHLRDEIDALRNHCIIHITTDGRARDAKSGAYISRTELLDLLDNTKACPKTN